MYVSKVVVKGVGKGRLSGSGNLNPTNEPEGELQGRRANQNKINNERKIIRNRGLGKARGQEGIRLQVSKGVGEGSNRRKRQGKGALFRVIKGITSNPNRGR